MPAANARAIEKARDLPCDVVILDLEDAVAPDAKDLARAQAVDAVKTGGFGRREVIIRVNGLDTPWGAEDLVAAIEAGPDAILAPKVSSAHDVRAYGRAITGDTRLWVMIETCAALFALAEIAAAEEASLAAFVIGTNDLAKEMRCKLTADRAPLLAPLSLALAAGRARGLTVLDGVFNGIDDDEGLVAQCAQGAAFGFDGKTLIHPRQIEAANLAFTPAAEDVAWARTVVQAFDSPENAAKGVIRVEGRMVERLHLDEARRLIAVADAIAAA
jgi:citrate lyase subunit beta/citryl-CoA lyase